MLPHLLASVPEARVVIVGHYSSVHVCERDHVTMLDRVADVSVELQRAAVVVAPIHLGGGMRVKVVEALAAGKAVVGTSKAFAGMSAPRDGAAICADGDAEFAAAVARLMTDDEERTQLGDRARAWAEANLSWSNSLQRYDDLYTHAHPRRAQTPALMSRDLLRQLDWRLLLPTPPGGAFEQLVIVGAGDHVAARGAHGRSGDRCAHVARRRPWAQTRWRFSPAHDPT